MARQINASGLIENHILKDELKQIVWNALTNILMFIVYILCLVSLVCQAPFSAPPLP